jgi:hypothetical protein
MVGPEVEEKAQVRHVSRLFVTAASLRVPFFSVVLRKGYGLGAMGMTAGGFHAPSVHRRLAHGRVRRHGAGRRGAPGLSQGAGSGARRPQREALFDNWWRSSMPTARP